MGSPLGCLFSLVIAFFAVLLVILTSIVRKAKDIMSQFSPHKDNRQSAQSTQNRQQSNSSSTSGQAQAHKKVFEDNEGEYVDFEEIK